MNKLFIFVAMAFVMISFASAINTFEATEAIDFKEPCFNEGAYCSAAAVCNITITLPNQTLIVAGAGMQNQGAFHNYTLSAEETTPLGIYERCITCTDVTLSDAVCKDFEITPTGKQFTTADSITYVILLFVALTLFGLSLWGALAIRWSNFWFDDGELAGISSLKYLKLGCMLFAYLSLMFITYISRGIATNLLHFDLASGIFIWISGTLLVFLFPILVVLVIFGLKALIMDVKFYKEVERGFAVKG